MYDDRIINQTAVVRLDICYWGGGARKGGTAHFIDGGKLDLSATETADLFWGMAEKIPASPGYYLLNPVSPITAEKLRYLVSRNVIGGAFTRLPVVAWALQGESCAAVTVFGIAEHAAVFCPGGLVVEPTSGGRHKDVEAWLLDVAHELEVAERIKADGD